MIRFGGARGIDHGDGQLITFFRFDVYGRMVWVAREGDAWSCYYPGQEGKRRRATDLHIPADIAEDQLAQYLGDLCHEWAGPDRRTVRQF